METIRDLGFDSVPGIAGSFSGRIALCGSGRNLWEDIQALGDWAGHWMAVKWSGLNLPFEFQHWAGMHGEQFQWLIPLRGYVMHNGKAVANCKGITVHSNKPWPNVHCAWPGDESGTSSLFAARIALALGYDEVMVLGCPLDGAGRYYDAPWAQAGGVGMEAVRDVHDFSNALLAWEKYAKVFDGRVKSMSGKTREILGGV